MVPAVAAVSVGAGGVLRFRVDDPPHALAAVRLYQELQRPYDGPELAWRDGVWRVELPSRGALRIEYGLSVRYPDGRVESGPDGGNPRRARGPFGEKSVVELAGYRRPPWLREADPSPWPASVREVVLPSRRLRRPVRALLWTSTGGGGGDRLPLLVAHDGPEYAEFSQLLTYLDLATAAHRLPAMHAALLAPGDRNAEYSASDDYADALAFELMPAVAAQLAVPADRWARVGMGASLGAVAMLHAQRRHRGLFGGLFLQSGSFFQPRTDPEERGFAGFAAISHFVQGVLDHPGAAPDPVTVQLTCGTVEENLANNENMAAALARQGYAVALGRIADGHNWVSWRDTFDLHLASLLGAMWGRRSEQPDAVA